MANGPNIFQMLRVINSDKGPSARYALVVEDDIGTPDLLDWHANGLNASVVGRIPRQKYISPSLMYITDPYTQSTLNVSSGLCNQSINQFILSTTNSVSSNINSKYI